MQQVALRRDIYSQCFCPRPEYWQTNNSFSDFLEILKEEPIVKFDRGVLKTISSPGVCCEGFDNCCDVFLSQSMQMPPLFDEDIPRRASFHVSKTSTTFHVELDAPDRVLEDLFKFNVRSARRRLQEKQVASRGAVVGKPALAALGTVVNLKFETWKWYKFGMLPYMDIMLWAIDRGIWPIENAIMGKKVLPDGRTGVEHRIKATTRVQAEKILTMSHYEFRRKIYRMNMTGW
jgi:hypothetical protein